MHVYCSGSSVQLRERGALPMLLEEHCHPPRLFHEAGSSFGEACLRLTSFALAGQLRRWNRPTLPGPPSYHGKSQDVIQPRSIRNVTGGKRPLDWRNTTGSPLGPLLPPAHPGQGAAEASNPECERAQTKAPRKACALRPRTASRRSDNRRLW